jgi:catechol 2,3-dioxygenase-like lactoylglutathione lyase family enzyme
MSYVALATDSFDEMVRFYGEVLLFPVISRWDRPTGRGQLFDLGGALRLEILDNARQRQPAALLSSDGRTHVVIEVADLELARANLSLDTPEPQTTSWGARLFQILDPDGTTVTYLQWTHHNKASQVDQNYIVP